MKKFLLLICLSALSFTGIKSQNWSATLNTTNGLPGESNTYYGEMYYTYNSTVFTPGGTLDIIRITVTGTKSNENPDGNNVTFALSGLKVYDGNGNEVTYTARSNADHNTLSGDEDGDGLPALSDNDIKSYFHSMWSVPAVADYHYVELILSRKVSSFSLEWTTRLGTDKNIPTAVGITLGTEYIPSDNKAEMTIGNAVTSEDVMADKEQLFVLKGNATTYFNAANGSTYSGSGPIFMQCAEAGDKEANSSHIMQLIPYEDGKYLVYWPVAGKFLHDSGSEYNGLNGWQYSTTNIEDAAVVDFTPIAGGYFGMCYESTYNNSPITLYVGAEMRDDVVAKMKTFDLEHKNYLENGDYTKGYSLPIAFNWSIYKAEVDKEAVNVFTIQKIAEVILNSTINKATSYIGSYDIYCKNNEDAILESKIAETRTFMTASDITVSDIVREKDELLEVLSDYVATKLAHYSELINTIASNAQFSSYPYYIKDTYPETSRSMLESLQETITNAQSHRYSIEEYEAIYNQIERDIELFENTKITETTTPDKEEEEEDTTEEDILFVYLSNGNIDAYAKSIMDGEHYIENGRLYIPLKEGEMVYYEKKEYSSCSKVKPSLPTMETYKFNNKYNPNLHVDAIAEPVTGNINFRLNAIGKWLTASFTLSDDKAVAYVDTVLQVSKETRQSFKEPVTYHVTYPGYNIIKNVKVQDEIWTDPTTDTQIVDVPLTADMLYTNKPSVNSNEGLENLLDNNSRTIFHSTNGSANNATLNVNTYITIDLPEALEKIQIYYQCRPQAGYNPLIWDIYASNDGVNWKLARTLDYITDNMPRGGAGQEFTSNTIDLGGKYSKIKILQIQGEYSKNHLVLSELRIKKVIESTSGTPVKIQDAKYEIKRVPYGNSYKVKVDWLTDTPTVPRIDIDIDGGYFVTSKDYYLNARFRITGYGIYENFEDSVQIKGRGNSSWSYSKKPYRLKFEEKVKPFGLTKGKSWVLLANAQKGSLMANAISMKIGQMAGAEYTNHIVPVELYMNGEYMGSYMFTEKVGLANNSVDVDEDTGYLLELDTNSDDEYKFYSSSYNLPVFVKEPDLNDPETPNVTARKRNIPAQFNEFCSALYQGKDVDGMVDMDALARFMLAIDLSLNQELGHPKSVFLFKENENGSSSKYKFGPIWDFDWGYGYENGSKYCYSGTTSSVFNYNMSTESGYKFFNDLLNVESFKKYYYKTWVEFINNNSIDELFDYIDHYYAFAENSFTNNTSIWGSSCGFAESDKSRHKSWIQERANYIYNNLDKYDINDLIYTLAGDVSNNNQLTIHDVALVTAYLNGNTHESFSSSKADHDKNGRIELNDARMIATLVEEGDAPSVAYWLSTPQAIGEFYSDDIVIEVGDVQSASLNLLEYTEEQYKAMQFDITIPEGMSLIDIIQSDAISEHNFSYTEIGENAYRVIAYSDEDNCFSTDGMPLIELILNSLEIINEENCMVKISNAYFVDHENNELHLNDHKILFSQATGINYNGVDLLIEGGECISITSLEPQDITIYSVDGRKIRSFRTKKGTTRIAIPAGVYIVNGEKVVVR
ncbi:MAG: CotH kinase family protein [Bacteroidaceae bacterium]|nr:CotH kinase family protein [Bacteroidaceae bacterium]